MKGFIYWNSGVSRGSIYFMIWNSIVILVNYDVQSRYPNLTRVTLPCGLLSHVPEGPATLLSKGIWRHDTRSMSFGEITSAIWHLSSPKAMVFISGGHCWILFPTMIGCSLNMFSLGFNLVTRICDRCLAETGDKCDPQMNFRNMSSTAAWPLTGLDQNQYELLDAVSQSPWSAMPGFNLENISFDWLHNVYLGIGKDLCASGLLTLIEKNVYQGVDMDEILGDVHREIRATCSQHGFLILHFSATKFSSFSFQIVSGQNTWKISLQCVQDAPLLGSTFLQNHNWAKPMWVERMTMLFLAAGTRLPTSRPWSGF